MIRGQIGEGVSIRYKRLVYLFKFDIYNVFIVRGVFAGLLMAFVIIVRLMAGKPYKRGDPLEEKAE